MFHPVGHPMERGWVGRVDGDRVVHLAAQTLQSFFTGGGTAREHAQYPARRDGSPRACAAPAVDQDLRRARRRSLSRILRRSSVRAGSSPGRRPRLAPSRGRGGHGCRRRDRRVHGTRRVACERRRASEGPRLRPRPRAGRRDPGCGTTCARRLRLAGRASRSRRLAPPSTRATSSPRRLPSRSPASLATRWSGSRSRGSGRWSSASLRDDARRRLGRNRHRR